MALQKFDVHQALKEQCNEIATKRALSILTRDNVSFQQQFFLDLSFVPSTNSDKHTKFAFFLKAIIWTADSNVAI